MDTASEIPVDPKDLERLQLHIASLRPTLWDPLPPYSVGGCFVCFQRGGHGRGAPGDPAWAAAVILRNQEALDCYVVSGAAGAPYVPSFLAAREGRMLASAVDSLMVPPDVLLVNAAGRDHPRRAGLAFHMGWALGVPSIGVTDRPFVAGGAQPGPNRGDHTPVLIDGDHVGWWLRTRYRARPVVVSPGWRTDLRTALEVVLTATHRARTPEPIREARRLARTARAAAGDS